MKKRGRLHGAMQHALPAQMVLPERMERTVAFPSEDPHEAALQSEAESEVGAVVVDAGCTVDNGADDQSSPRKPSKLSGRKPKRGDERRKVRHTRVDLFDVGEELGEIV